MNNVLNKSLEVAINSLKNFIKNLGLNEEAFDHIYKIPIKLGNTTLDAPGEYSPDDFTININNDYFYDMASRINPTNENTIINNIALTIVHEMIHANRTIFIENGLKASNIEDAMDSELIKRGELNKGHDVDLYDSLLSDVLKLKGYDEFKTYIPIRYILNKDKTGTLIAYNKETKNYEEFNQKFDISFKDASEMIEELSKKINEEKYKPDYIIYTPNTKDTDIVLSSDYYHDDYSVRKDVPMKQYAKLQNDKANEIIDTLENQNGFEESLTETLATIIIMTRNDKELDLDRVTEKLMNSVSAEDEKIMARLINVMGKDMLIWFMKSAYESSYNDYMKNAFKDRYTDLLADVNDLYESTIYEEEPNEFSINDANEIITEYTEKRR